MPGPHSTMTRKTTIDKAKGKFEQHRRNRAARMAFNQELNRVFKGTNHTNIGFLTTLGPGINGPTQPGLVRVDKNWTKSSRRQSKRGRH